MNRSLALAAISLTIYLISVPVIAFAQDGPFNDEVYGAVSSDGVNFNILPGPFFRHASVPDILELETDCAAGSKGLLLLYFVDFSEAFGPGLEGISMSTSRDGMSWSQKTRVMINGKVNKGAAVDPSVVQLPDGKIRLYFFGSEITHGDPAAHAGDHHIYSAISDDGVNFTVEPEICFSEPHITDPEVIKFAGEWLMFISIGPETVLARSSDGKHFTRDDGFVLRIGGVPGAVLLSDGRIRVFTTGRGGIKSALFDPNTNSLPLVEDGDRISGYDARIVADPAAVIRSDRTYYLIFKKKP